MSELFKTTYIRQLLRDRNYILLLGDVGAPPTLEEVLGGQGGEEAGLGGDEGRGGHLGAQQPSGYLAENTDRIYKNNTLKYVYYFHF